MQHCRYCSKAWQAFCCYLRHFCLSSDFLWSNSPRPSPLHFFHHHKFSSNHFHFSFFPHSWIPCSSSLYFNLTPENFTASFHHLLHLSLSFCLKDPSIISSFQSCLYSLMTMHTHTYTHTKTQTCSSVHVGTLIDLTLTITTKCLTSTLIPIPNLNLIVTWTLKPWLNPQKAVCTCRDLTTPLVSVQSPLGYNNNNNIHTDTQTVQWLQDHTHYICLTDSHNTNQSKLLGHSTVFMCVSVCVCGWLHIEGWHQQSSVYLLFSLWNQKKWRDTHS